VTSQNALVSVIIPAYNRPKRTERAVQSVVKQTYRPIELIVVDDGSSPRLRETIPTKSDSLAEFHLIEHETNKGANAARNTGIDAANGEYIGFLDSDDEWVPEKIDRQIETIKSTGADFVYTGIRQVNEDGNVITVKNANPPDDIESELIKGNIIGTFSTIIVSTKVILLAGYPNPKLPCWQDWEWYLRLSNFAQIDAVESPLVIRHNEGGQISDNFQYKLKSFDIIKKRLGKNAKSELEKNMSRAYLHFHVGYSALSNNEYSAARSQLIKAISIYPKEPEFYKYLLASSPAYPALRRIKRHLFNG
jgi:glycosyltransferase involved in cell wall biosynthesis